MSARPSRLRLRAGLLVRVVVAGAAVLGMRAESQERVGTADEATAPAGAYERAAGAYLDGLRRLAHPPDEAERRMLARLALVLPPALSDEAATGAVSATLGARLAAWWAVQDPLPATPLNERVVEHTLRVASAAEAFPADTPTGLDARGEVFVRFGAPTYRRAIDFESDLFLARAIREEPSVRRTDFPRNEAWYYPALGPNALFLFVERNGTFVEGQTTDLLPRALLAGGIHYDRRDRAQLLGRALRWIYKDLYPFSGDIQRRLLALDGTVGGDGAAFDGNTALTLQSEVQRARQEDDVARQRRDDVLPPGATRIGGRPFGLERRVAEFRDGPPGAPTYAVWTGWSQPLAALAAVADSLAGLGVEPERFVLDVAAVRYEPDYAWAGADERRYLIEDGGPVTVPQWTRVEGVAPGGHVAFEWDLAPATAGGDVLPPGPIAATIARADSVGAEWAVGSIALSGLLPVDAEATLAMDVVDRLIALPPPHPFSVVRAGEPIAVYFEVYTTEPGAEVDVEVRAVKVQRGRLLRRETDYATATASTFTLRETRSPEVAVVDVPDLGEADEVRIEVVVTRPATGERAVRSVTFGVGR